MAIYWPTPGFKGRTFKLCVLTRWDFNFCVHSSPLRGKAKKKTAVNIQPWWERVIINQTSIWTVSKATGKLLKLIGAHISHPRCIGIINLLADGPSVIEWTSDTSIAYSEKNNSDSHVAFDVYQIMCSVLTMRSPVCPGFCFAEEIQTQEREEEKGEEEIQAFPQKSTKWSF